MIYINNNHFRPEKVFIEPAALDYPAGVQLHEQFKNDGIPVQFTSSHNRITGMPRQSPATAFREAKKILVVGVRRSKKFQTCRPSAHYQIPLATGCPGMCHYCYLHTNLGKRPYPRVYVNSEKILDKAGSYIRERCPEETIFEGAAVCDPLFAEHYTGIVSKAIKYFSKEEKASFRLVTKFDTVQSLLDLNHEGNTRIRFSLNHQEVINKYEKGTSSLQERLNAASLISKAGYPLGFMIAPIFLEGNWKQAYTELFSHIREHLGTSSTESTDSFNSDGKLTFELITHRFTTRARENIREVFPETPLFPVMQEEKRRFKYGQFGYGKYLYPQELFNNARDYFNNTVNIFFPGAKIDYFI